MDSLVLHEEKSCFTYPVLRLPVLLCLSASASRKLSNRPAVLPFLMKISTFDNYLLDDAPVISF